MYIYIFTYTYTGFVIPPHAACPPKKKRIMITKNGRSFGGYIFVEMHMSIIHIWKRWFWVECIRLRGRCQGLPHRGWHAAWQATGAPRGDGGFQEWLRVARENHKKNQSSTFTASTGISMGFSRPFVSARTHSWMDLIYGWVKSSHPEKTSTHGTSSTTLKSCNFFFWKTLVVFQNSKHSNKPTHLRHTLELCHFALAYTVSVQGARWRRSWHGTFREFCWHCCRPKKAILSVSKGITENMEFAHKMFHKLLETLQFPFES